MGCEPELLKKAAMPTAARKLDLPEGVPPLTSLYMYISGSCNLACRHCWISPTYEPDNSKGQFLKLEYVKKAVTEAKPLGLQSVKLTGGEPMLHPQIREIVEYIESENIGMIMETNGTLIDDKMARFLKSKQHFNFISVSVDGASAETHEELRGVPGSFEKAISGIKALVKAGFQPQMICTLHKGNVADINEILNFSENLGCGSIKFNHIQSIGRGEGFFHSHGLSVKEIIKLYNEIELQNHPSNKITTHFDIPIAFHSIKKLLNEHLPQCHIKNILGLLNGGELSLCGIGVLVSDLIFGKIEKDNIKNIWMNSKVLKEIRDLIPENFEGICRECIHHSFCQGTCIANNYFVKKKFNSAYYFCDIAEKNRYFPLSRKNYYGGLK